MSGMTRAGGTGGCGDAPAERPSQRTTGAMPQRVPLDDARGSAGDDVLVLQGGGALGAYQAGAFEALASADRPPRWIAGISIGAINAALVAGNPPERRVSRLRAFWHTVSHGVPSIAVEPPVPLARAWLNGVSAMWGVAFGLRGFFAPRAGVPVPVDGGGRPSYYDTAPLRRTLGELVDFDYLNRGPVRLSIGAVNVRTGNFVYFDSRQTRIGPEHIMASGALPPGFPSIGVASEEYWDGGLVSNTPLRHVLENLDTDRANIFQIDLFSARGSLPRTLGDVQAREKDIRFSSRTRAVTDALRERHELHQRIRRLASMLPADTRETPGVQAMLEGTNDAAITLVHLIRPPEDGETLAKDFEFSRASIDARWQAGRDAMAFSLRRLAGEPAHVRPGTFRVFDFGSPSPAGSPAAGRPLLTAPVAT